MRQQGVETIALVEQFPDDVVYRVNQARIHFNHAATDYLDAAGLADPRLIVAIHVGTHGQLGLIFLRVEQFQYALGIVYGRGPARNGTRNRTGLDLVALHPDKHLGRGAHQLVLAQIYQKFVGAGIACPNALEQIARSSGETGAKHLTEHDLEKIPALGAGDDLSHLVGVFPRRMIAPHLRSETALCRQRSRFALQAHRRKTRVFNIVLILQRQLLLVIHNDQLIGQKQV